MWTSAVVIVWVTAAAALVTPFTAPLLCRRPVGYPLSTRLEVRIPGFESPEPRDPRDPQGPQKPDPTDRGQRIWDGLADLVRLLFPWTFRHRASRRGKYQRCITDQDCVFPQRCFPHPVFKGEKFCSSGWGSPVTASASDYAFN
jgi:hypothetical protein